MSEEERILKVLLFKRVANLGTVPLPSTNIFTTNEFERSYGPFKEPIRKVTRNLDPKHLVGREARW